MLSPFGGAVTCNPVGMVGVEISANQFATNQPPINLPPIQHPETGAFKDRERFGSELRSRSRSEENCGLSLRRASSSGLGGNISQRLDA